MEETGAELGRLDGELCELDAARDLAQAYWRRLKNAETVIRALRWTTDSNNDRRRVVEVLLHRVDARTLGEGHGKRAELTFH